MPQATCLVADSQLLSLPRSCDLSNLLREYVWFYSEQMIAWHVAIFDNGIAAAHAV